MSNFWGSDQRVQPLSRSFVDSLEISFDFFPVSINPLFVGHIRIFSFKIIPVFYCLLLCDDVTAEEKGSSGST